MRGNVIMLYLARFGLLPCSVRGRRIRAACAAGGGAKRGAEQQPVLGPLVFPLYMKSVSTFLLALVLVLCFTFALAPLRRKHPVLAAGAFGGGGAALMMLVGGTVGAGAELLLWKSGLKVLLSALLWAGLARARVWHAESSSGL